ncbi:unnamed protein product [Protopolystoma xenopodis]|uniref:Uncharacterized protein n=1 Tax=Protopolystoma xenopodis TaxID=117903 RepID=A0A448XEU5_9PLAT|nr:unnamed protein product [Protopolystoma xenopodis]
MKDFFVFTTQCTPISVCLDVSDNDLSNISADHVDRLSQAILFASRRAGAKWKDTIYALPFWQSRGRLQLEEAVTRLELRMVSL